MGPGLTLFPELCGVVGPLARVPPCHLRKRAASRSWFGVGFEIGACLQGIIRGVFSYLAVLAVFFSSLEDPIRVTGCRVPFNMVFFQVK